MSVPPAPVTAHPSLHEIQGNLVGFNKDHERLVFLQLPPDPAQGKALLAEMAREVASGTEVLAFNRLFKKVHQRRGAAGEGTVQATWINIALTAAGLRAVGAPDVDAFPPDFVAGMAADAARIGDQGASAPAGWVAPFNAPASVHAMIIIAADSPADLQDADARLQQTLAGFGAVRLGAQDGNARPGEARGHEHFGFKDGISQPSIHGLTKSSKAAERPDVAAGEFLIGFPDQDGNISGQIPTVVPSPGQPGYPPTTPPATQPLPGYAHAGSFLVYRRLRQDVPAFQAFVQTQGAALGLDSDAMGAKLMGRWKSGAPMEPITGQPPAGQDPSVTDPSVADPTILDDANVNRFDYEPDDTDGHRVAQGAHVRKSYPRGSLDGGRAEADRHRILRRGLPYGPEVQTGEPGYGQQPVTETTDRGLLFLCYQSSITRGFAFVQGAWSNKPDFPHPGAGQDPITSQDSEPRDVALSPPNPHVAMAQWVTTTGGEYFFSPSISGLEQLAS